MLGLDGAGKTAILDALTAADAMNAMETKPTEGYAAKTLLHDDHRVKILDISGKAIDIMKSHRTT